jgi:hypothetical protein
MDNNNFITRIDETTNDILQIVNKCTIEQLNYKQGESWNILEIIEHLYLTDKVIYTIISRPSKTINSSTEIVGKEAIQKVMLEQRGEKITSPDILKPKGEIKDITILVDMFVNQRNTWKNSISTSEILIDNRVHKHPLLGEMTISDWLNFAIHHTQRHFEQIKDIINN